MTEAIGSFDYVRCYEATMAALASPLVLKTLGAGLVHAIILDFLFNPRALEARAPLLALVAATGLCFQLIPHRDKPTNVFTLLPAGRLTRLAYAAYFALAPVTSLLLGAGIAVSSISAALFWLEADEAGRYAGTALLVVLLSVMGIIIAALTYLGRILERLNSDD